MRLLLDTHAFIWWLAGDRRLSAAARAAIGDDANEIFVSAASAWEITTKFRIGKLPEAGLLAADVVGAVAGQGFVELPISLVHAQAAGSLSWAHRDPFDRVLAVQAAHENLTLVSNDAIFDGTAVARLW